MIYFGKIKIFFKSLINIEIKQSKTKALIKTDEVFRQIDTPCAILADENSKITIDGCLIEGGIKSSNNSKISSSNCYIKK